MILALALSLAAHASTGDFLSDLDLFQQRSLAVRTSKQEYSAAGSNALSKLLQFTPRLSAGIGREWNKLDTPSPLSNYDTRDWYWRASADWNLFHSGGDYLAWRAAKASEASSGFAVKGQELKTQLDGANVIFKRLYLRDYLAAQDELLKLKQETLRIGRDRYRQGKIPLQDVVKMEVDLSQQQNVVRSSQIDMAENEASYRAFFVDSLRTNEWPFSGKETGEGGNLQSFEQLRLRKAADAFDFSWKSSITRHAPSVDFTLAYKSYPFPGQDNKSWAGQLELSVPIWSRWEIASENAQAYAASVRAADEADQNARDEELRREFLRKKVGLSRASLDEARANLDRADRLYRDMLRSFQLGRLSTNDLFLEQDRKIRAVVSLSQARLDFHSAVMESCSLRGLSAAECLK